MARVLHEMHFCSSRILKFKLLKQKKQLSLSRLVTERLFFRNVLLKKQLQQQSIHMYTRLTASQFCDQISTNCQSLWHNEPLLLTMASMISTTNHVDPPMASLLTMTSHESGFGRETASRRTTRKEWKTTSMELCLSTWSAESCFLYHFYYSMLSIGSIFTISENCSLRTHNFLQKKL